MVINYVGLKEISGSLIVLDGVKGASYEEVVDIKLGSGNYRKGRVVQVDGDRIVVQVFEGTQSISLDDTKVKLQGHPMEISLSPEILGRVFNGSGEPIDNLGRVFPQKKVNINGTPINPISRMKSYGQSYRNLLKITQLYLYTLKWISGLSSSNRMNTFHSIRLPQKSYPSI